VEACSGVRYLIASVTLGFLFAYLTYQKLSKRILFVGLSIVVPIIANGLRAYMIVMIGHFSDMQLATGVDHLFYGWLFFGVVMMILFSIGSIWRDTELAPATSSGADPADRDQPVAPGRAAIAFMVVVSCTGFWPLFAEYSGPGKSIDAGTTSLVFAAGNGWKPSHNEPWHWKPDTEQADIHLNRYFTNSDGGGTISLHLIQYFNQEQGREVVTSDTHLITGKEDDWRVIDQGRREVGLGGRAIAVREARLSNDRQDLLVWSWYRIGSHYTANIYIGKLWQVYAQLFDRRYDAAMIMIASEFDSYTDKDAIAARERMQLFIDARLPAVEASLDAAIPAGVQ
jgi:EpsI family protein